MARPEAAFEPDLTLPMHQRLPEDGVWEKFNPVELSGEEQAFVLEHMGEPPAVALAGWDRAVPHNPDNPDAANYSINEWRDANPGITPVRMSNLLGRIFDVHTASPKQFGYYKRNAQAAIILKSKPGEEFYGFDAIKTALTDCQEYFTRYETLKEQSPAAALHPAMYTQDARGKLHFQGVGSDRGMIRWFTCWILHQEIHQLAPEWSSAAASESVIDTKEVDHKVAGIGANYALIEGDNYFECCVDGCNYRQTFELDNDGDRRKARNSIRLHMSKTKTKADDHQEAKVVIFGS